MFILIITVMNFRKFIISIILISLPALSTNAQTTKTFYWTSIIKLFTASPEFSEAHCENCGIKLHYNSSGKLFKVTHFEHGELTTTDEVRFVGYEDGFPMYEVLGMFGTGTHSYMHYLIKDKSVLLIHYELVPNNRSSTGGFYYTDKPSYIFEYTR